MAEFILDEGTDGWFATLDEFTQAYVEALIWTEEPSLNEQTDEPIGVDLLSNEARQQIVADCAAFQGNAASRLLVAYRTTPNYNARQAGHDFWLTRNHHGAGFWDRGLDDVGDMLTREAHDFGSCDAYLGDDGRVYLG